MKENLLCAFCAKSFRPRGILRFFAERKLKETEIQGPPAMTFGQSTRNPVGWVLTQQFKPAAFSIQRATVTLNLFQGLKRAQAFSLVEMLMALLVASLLLAALAPVMTKRMDEAKINISGVGAAQYDKDSLISIYTGAPDEDKIFNVPSDVTMIKATLIGGGGAGGNSFYGKQEVITSKSWTVPEGVTKLRVFMLGGGGGGASGGLGTGTAKIPAGGDGNTYKDFGEGETTFTIPSTATAVPALDSACAASGATAWTGVSDGKSYTPGKVAVSVTACGGGGGGGGTQYNTGGGGGSGGYVTGAQLQGSLPQTIYIKVGGGGGGGGSPYSGSSTQIGLSGGYSAGGGGGAGFISGNGNGGDSGTYGGTGGNSVGRRGTSPSGGEGTGVLLSNGGGGGTDTGYNNYAGGGGRGGIWGGGGGGAGVEQGGGGGGGGGPVTISTASGVDESKIVFQIGGGGGGGGGGHTNADAAAGGGGGGGYGSGGGGGGGGSTTFGSGGLGSTNLSAFIGIGTGSKGNDGTLRDSARGGGGGGGYGGKSGAAAGSVTAGTIGSSTVWKSSNYCDGGNGAAANSSPGSSGKPGRLRLYYTYPELKCDFSLPANGSGGGGAGQLVVGEINVTPGETLYFEVGSGGNTQAAAGKDGNAGNATNIRRGGPSGTIIAQALGGLPGHYSSAENTESQGGSYRVNTAIGTGQTLDNNWTGIKYNAQSGTGSNGKLANALVSKGYGGSGGTSQNMKGETVAGGQGGNSVKNGASPDLKSYGAGGGGGAGSPVIGDTTYGIGAAGAAGYIYFEYGGSNGGGGTAGEMITKIITNIKGGSEVKINIGEGGDNSTGDGSGKTTSIEYMTSTAKSLSARGGLRGNDGLIKDVHAEEKLLPSTYANKNEASAKGGAGEALYGGIGGYIEHLYENADGTWATYIKAKDGTIGGPVLGGCGGNLTALTGAILCNGSDSAPNGKDGTFGGGGGGGAVINETGGLGGRGGRGMVILEYKAVGL